MSPMWMMTFSAGALSRSIISYRLSDVVAVTFTDSAGAHTQVFISVCWRMNSTESAPSVS